ncbi:mitochondrial 54S ribosomal protein mL49 [Lodderomyces beijingensis]|uniref:Large ribosomal subunit protein mL49 n=1 Tax=Lodderomyces beijingensis TaxID=1775926 RepID=A0ABP0ZRU0_9ASCO
MKQTARRLLNVKPPQPDLTRYAIPDLASISQRDLPNNGFGIKNYFIPKTRFSHWPVYIKTSNSTKVVTEIKRVQGDIHQFKRDLLRYNEEFVISMNQAAGIVNIKGDHVDEVKSLLDREIN